LPQGNWQQGTGSKHHPTQKPQI